MEEGDGGGGRSVGVTAESRGSSAGGSEVEAGQYLYDSGTRGSRAVRLRLQ